ncbi:DNA-methyltransferase [Hugenholtzia roseola]|uniref:DNA-methyltransferase n=1 Tax=Hugenholtzia roseola TaxID=1002 RepID=UPI0004180431|nr:DNA methyltransferase [Hugenholtzia roseola]
MTINKLILGDCLEVLKTIESETVDLIYIDPPFFSNRTYEIIWGDTGEVRSFEDRFSGGIDHYIAWLKERIQEMHRILKPTGSIFVHCDWHANAYIRVYILDKIFGNNNYVNEIIWYYYNKFQGNINKLAANHDIIYWYAKSKKFTFNKIKEKRDEKIKQIKRVWDKETSKIVNAKDENGKVQYIETDERTVDDVWRISMLQPADKKERIGYPTQKPEAILERVINLASNEGDTILDCFVGGGTTVAVADKLNRNWVGIDQSVQAIKVTEFRLNKQQSLFSRPFTVQLHKYDYDTLRYKDAFEFETWIVGQFDGISNAKQRGDLGLDGRTRENQPIQVKRSDNVGRNVIDNFKSACERYDKTNYEKNKTENKPVGFIIAFSFGRGAIQEVARLKNEENVIIKLVTVEEIVPIAKKPTLKVEVKDLGEAKGSRKIEFAAAGQSDAGIEFYAWDFAYQEPNFIPEILLDKAGKQTYLFKAGEHKIAVKVVDNEGLESLEVVKLKINGVVSTSK